MGCGASAGGKKQQATIDAQTSELSALKDKLKAAEAQASIPAAAGPSATLPIPTQAGLPGAVPETTVVQVSPRTKGAALANKGAGEADAESQKRKSILEDIQCGLCLPSGNREGGAAKLIDETAESKASREMMMRCLQLRHKYMFRDPGDLSKIKPAAGGKFVMVVVDGIAEIEGIDLPPVPNKEEYRTDLVELWKMCKHPAVQSLAASQLERLETTFKTHTLNHLKCELDSQTELCEDLYSVMKVDNHIHLAAAMSPVMFLKFIRDKLISEPDRDVAKGKTLRQAIQEAVEKSPKPPGTDVSKLSHKDLGLLVHADSLRMCAGDHFYHRFDNFNSAYQPLGSALLRTLFMKTSNDMGGEYFGQLTHGIIESFERHHTYAEMRLSVYGKDPKEWDDLARWIKAHDLHKEQHTKRNMWMVQIPRVYKVFYQAGFVKNFEEFINNIFQGLFEVALDPNSHPDLAEVMSSITGFDCVDDESISDPLCARRSQVYGDAHVSGSVDDALNPRKWAVAENPPYSYYCYYLYVNIKRFNDLCKVMGCPWNLTLRPHAGEAGEVHHLATAFLLTDGINHGINLWHSPVLQYLYYLAQIGVSVAPVSNNSLFLKMKDNPFPNFLRRGLNVSLSTDDPLMFHTTNQPLLEEYTASRLVFGLSNVDLMEVAANSVRQSGFPKAMQAQALGESVYKPGPPPFSWDPEKCNIPERRLRYRRKLLAMNLQFLRDGPWAVAEVSEPKEDPNWLKWMQDRPMAGVAAQM